LNFKNSPRRPDLLEAHTASYSSGRRTESYFPGHKAPRAWSSPLTCMWKESEVVSVHTAKVDEGNRGKLHPFLTLALGVGGRFTPREWAAGTHWIRG